MTSQSPGPAVHDGQKAALDAMVADLFGEPKDPPRPATPASAAQLVDLITSRTWRRTAVDTETLADIRAKVGRATAGGTPVEFAVPFGGYKGWRCPSAPLPDWAEVFWVDHLRRQGERIAASHPGGVEISFSYVGGVLWWINGTRPADEDAYIGAFSRLLAHRSSPRVRLRLVDLSHAYGGPRGVMGLLEQRERAAPPPSESELRSARRNLIPSGDRRAHPDRTGDDEEVAVERAARRCAAMMSLEARRDFNKYGPRIQLTHIRGSRLSLHVSSCRSATAQPWVSHGFLEWRPGTAEWIERLATDPTFCPGYEMEVAHPLIDLSPSLARIPLAMPVEHDRRKEER